MRVTLIEMICTDSNSFIVIQSSYKATPDNESNGSLFYLIPVGLREVAIQHIESQRYIAINKRAKLIAKEGIILYQRKVSDSDCCTFFCEDIPFIAFL